MKNSMTKWGWQGLLVAFVTILFASTVNSQPEPITTIVQEVGQPPTDTLFSYQGQLLDAAGAPITNPEMPMIFKLYDQAVNGTLCWVEDRTGTGTKVAVEDGHFHVNLGSITPFPDTCFDGDLYLQLIIDGEPLYPREQLTSVFHAKEANRLPNDAISGSPLIIEPRDINGEGGEIRLVGGNNTNDWTIDNRFGKYRLFSEGNIYFSIDPDGDTLVDGSLNLNFNPLQGALLWPPSYGGGSQAALPGFFDSLYHATERGFSVTANRPPEGGTTFDSLFTLNTDYAQWTNVSSSNPVELTITHPNENSTWLVQGVMIAFGWRSSLGIDYTVEYLHDADDDGTYEWQTFVNESGNDKYQVYNGDTKWRVQSIRITVTNAGTADQLGKLRIATIQAYSGIHGKPTGTMLDISGDSMYGTLNMNSNDLIEVGILEIEGAGAASMEIGQLSSENMYFDLTEGSATVFRNMVDPSNCPPSQPNCEMMKIKSNGNTIIYGSLDLRGGCATSYTNNPSTVDAQCTSSSIISGAYIEANLQTPIERMQERTERFSHGDLLCWNPDKQQLDLCQIAEDRLVQAVADPNGKPIVLGAEPIKVIGTVQAGDILVTSDTPGYAMVNNNPAPGTVIAQALENFNGESGTIKAMIRKW